MGLLIDDLLSRSSCLWSPRVQRDALQHQECTYHRGAQRGGYLLSEHLPIYDIIVDTTIWHLLVSL